MPKRKTVVIDETNFITNMQKQFLTSNIIEDDAELFHVLQWTYGANFPDSTCHKYLAY